MEVAYTKKAQEHLLYWKNSGNRKIMSKISDLVTAIAVDPFGGIGKPEPLKHELSGCWSRRINGEHRIVYELTDNKILVHSLKGHY